MKTRIPAAYIAAMCSPCAAASSLPAASYAVSGTRCTVRNRLIRTACLLEATARKAGNVHPRASFADLAYDDFVASADVAAPALSRAREIGVGRAVFAAIEATRNCVGKNTNLGIVLLLSPL